jgi:predicted nucleic acid-binding protein
MADYYFDASALVKAYITEMGSIWVSALINARSPDGRWKHTISLSRIGIVETAAAIARRHRMRLLSRDERDSLYDRFIRDSRTRLDPTRVTNSILDLAADLTQRHPLRGYDAVHLATALVLRDHLIAARLPAPIFVAADANLCAVARAEGLAAENPNDYP